MSGSSIRILLIEDDPEYAYLLQEMLKTAHSASFDVTHSDHLAGGLNQLVEGSFDVILLDLSLPDSWGFETFAMVHAQAPDVPIVPLSGLDDERLAMHAVRAGAQDYLIKGETDTKLLTRTLCYAVERKRAEQLLRALNQASLAMEKALTPEAIFTAALEELSQLGISCIILPMDESRSRLSTRYTKFESEPMRTAEKRIDFRREDYSFPIEDVDLYRTVVQEKKTISARADEVMQQILPELHKGFTDQAPKTARIPKFIAAPLIVKDDVIGVLSVHSDDLIEGDIPAITAFAHQMAAAWHRAQLYEQAQQEIAERKRAESALRESERRFATFMEHLPGIAFMKDTQGRYLYRNQAFEEAHGAKATEWQGKTDDEIWPADIAARMRASDQWVMAKGKGLETIEEISQEDGIHHWLTIKFPIADENGKPSVLAGIAVNVTEHLQAQEELLRRNEELVALNAIAMTINQSLDLNHTLNATLHKVTEVIEQDGGWIQLLDDVTGTLSLAAHHGLSPEMVEETRTTEFGEGVTGEAVLSRQVVAVTGDPDGRCASAQVARQEGLQACVGVPIMSKDRVLGAMGICSRSPRQMSSQEMQLLTAIGHQIGTAIENAQLAQEAAEVHILQELNRLRTELIANVSHELRTPLGLIKVYSTTLLAEDVNFDRETQKECLRTIDEETERLETIVDNLLDLSRMEGGRLHLDQRPTDIGQLVKEIVQAMGVQTTQHSFVLDLPTHPLMAQVDARRIEQVLRNLLSNAIKYSPDGGTITIQAQGDDDQLLVGVSDEGIGIPSYDLEKVFERFYRIENEVTQRTSGVGLGLAVCRGIVEAHGGRIWAESIPGGGSTFYFTLRDDGDA
jgi:PAS domain S-box-containing protein